MSSKKNIGLLNAGMIILEERHNWLTLEGTRKSLAENDTSCVSYSVNVKE